MNRSARTRAIFTCFSLAICFTAFSFRLADIQVSRHEEYAKQATLQHGDRLSNYARRGSIQDALGEVLAEDEPVKTVVADATLIADDDMADVASVLAGPLQMTESDILVKLKRQALSEQTGEMGPCPYIILKKEVPENVAELIKQKIAESAAQEEQAQKNAPKPDKNAPKKDKAAKDAERLAQQKHASKWRSVFFEQSAVRVYPNDQLLCHVVGYVDHSGTGMEGVEKSMEKNLHGIEGFRYIERDRKGTEIVPYRGEERAAQNGNNVRLTINMGLQNIVESEMDAAIKQFHPKGATIILMNPKTGEILAMANRPNYNPNVRNGIPEESRRNRAIADMVEPGSTFKIVTTSAALTEKIVSLDTKIFCENGFMASCKLHDHHPYGDLSVGEILIKSSNIGAAKLAIQLGDQRFYEYVRRFGFGERTGVSLPGEIPGVVYPPHRWSKISITRMPMGQEVGATPLQVAVAMCAIANGGHLMMPQIIHEIVDEHGNSVTQFPPQEIRRVASKEATDAVREALEQVVSPKGTAALARVLGYRVAGKTGTAQKADPEHHGYDHEKYVVSFVGYMPAEDPAFVGIVMLDEAQAKHGENYGGTVAAPVFSRIGERAARYLGLKPTVEEPPGSILAGQPLNFRDQ